MNIAQTVMHLYPNANPTVDFIAQDDSDGNGAYIAQWNLSDPQPTVEELQAAWDAMQPSESDILEQYKKLKLDELKATEEAKLATFKSSALGTEHTYLSGLSDMLLLSDEFHYITGAYYDEKPIIWYTQEEGNISHTKEQFIQVYLDGRADISTVKYNRAGLDYQVQQATSEEEINSIVW